MTVLPSVFPRERASPIRVNCPKAVKGAGLGADGCSVGASASHGSLRRRVQVCREDGVTLPELLIVLTILALVIAPLVASFSTALRNQSDQSKREAAYSAARLALQRMRVDVHCSSSKVQDGVVQENAFGGFTLTLQEATEGSPGYCETVIPPGTGSNGVQWCTIPVTGSTTRFRLYRYLGLDPNDCDGGSGSTFQVDFVTVPSSGWPTNSTALGIDPAPTPGDWIGNLWPTPEACPANRLPTLTVLLNTSVNPDETPKRNYQLRDALALRNAVR